MPPAPRPQAARTQAPRTEPFSSAEDAWFWTMAALAARREGARIKAGQGLVARPCEPDDVVKVLDRLYRQRRIELAHARILRIWGERGMPPDPRSLPERGDARLWREAMARLEWPLRVKGIVDDTLPARAPADGELLPVRSPAGGGTIGPSAGVVLPFPGPR